jgi:hypothetical protein
VAETKSTLPIFRAATSTCHAGEERVEGNRIVGEMLRSREGLHCPELGKYSDHHEIQGVLDEVRFESGAGLRRI